MSDKQCPGEAELLGFVDGDLPPERADRIAAHLAACASCAEKVTTLRDLIDDVRAPVPGVNVDLGDHVADVMRLLDAPVAAQPALRRWLPLAAGGVALAASIAVVVALRGSDDEMRGRFTARGSGAEASLSRDIGVQLYAKDAELRPLHAGSRIRAGTALTAGLRNLGKERAYLLLFAVDARNEVHWIAPEFTLPSENPEAVGVLPARDESLLPSAVAFDDLSPGALRVVALISPRPLRVSEIESLPAAELDGAGLVRRFPGAEIRQFQLDVSE
jgi:hypothetical protein